MELEYGMEELHDVFSGLAEECDTFEFFTKYFFPHIVGKQYESIRKGIFLSVASHGSYNKRSRIHVLLLGKPGTGKTEILKWIESCLGGEFIDAQYASKVGLVGDARGDEIHPGILARCDGKILCIDELDKMSATDQYGLLEAMEEGEYTIVKGRHHEKFKSEVVVIASANDGTKIHKPLLDRFDFIYMLAPPSREERAEQATKIVRGFFGSRDLPDHNVLYEYLQWIDKFTPEITPNNIKLMEKVMREYIERTSFDISKLSYRTLELGILRTTTAIAKIRHKDIDVFDMIDALYIHSGKEDKELIEELRDMVSSE